MNENYVEELLEAEEEMREKEGLMSRLKNFGKSHGKKVAIGAAIIGGIWLGYLNGRKSTDEYIEIESSNDDDVEVTIDIDEEDEN